MHRRTSIVGWTSVLLALLLAGCSALPDFRQSPRFHNPFPQLTRIAILPFNNLTEEPTLNQDEVAGAYQTELQAIPGFEVLPLGVTKNGWLAFRRERNIGVDSNLDGEVFQDFARYLGVDAVVVGAVTDYTPYYPPRMGMTTHWYAANTGFHPIPVGYGLPWGTKAEKDIPDWVKLESEMEVARQQLATQSPAPSSADDPSPTPPRSARRDDEGRLASQKNLSDADGDRPRRDPVTAADHPVITADHQVAIDEGSIVAEDLLATNDPTAQGLPIAWPDPSGLVPPAPQPVRPPLVPQSEPVLSHTRLYHGHDSTFTERLAAYYDIRDDARFGGWQAYLQRSDDFIRFVCHLHITEMLESRGGRDPSDLILRWPIGRYDY
jgi:hypothetical protein